MTAAVDAVYENWFRFLQSPVDVTFIRFIPCFIFHSFSCSSQSPHNAKLIFIKRIRCNVLFLCVNVALNRNGDRQTDRERERVKSLSTLIIYSCTEMDSLIYTVKFYIIYMYIQQSIANSIESITKKHKP